MADSTEQAQPSAIENNNSSPASLESIVASIADLLKRIEALENKQDDGTNPVVENKTSTGEPAVKANTEPQPNKEQDKPEAQSRDPVEDFLSNNVEFRKQVYVDGDYTMRLVVDEKPEVKVQERKPFRYDSFDSGELTFSVHQSAALYDILLRLCPPNQNNEVRVIDEWLMFDSAFPLLHCRDELNKLEKKKANDKITAELKVMQLLYERQGHLLYTKQHYDELLKKKQIDAGSLGGLFLIDQLVVFRELRDQWVVSRVKTIEIPRIGDYKLRLECEAIDFDGKNFRNRLYEKQIEEFSGTKKIAELPVYPLSYHHNKEAIIEDSIKSGRRWRDLHEQLKTTTGQPVAKVMQYEGYGETFEYDVGSEIAGRVIVDPTKYPDRRLEFAEHNKDPFQNELGSDGSNEDDPLVLCPEKVLVYSLSDNEWYYVATSKLNYPIWISDAWDRLVKPVSTPAAGSVERIRLLAKAHDDAAHPKESVSDLNNFRGKGKGLTFLLHGPPGVGKTMLAECLSEEHKMPLYRVNLGRFVAGDQWETEIETIFRQAYFWGAYLLIDEAEVVMLERTTESMESLAWVAVFLRKMEYFEGVLFLTTNQIHMIDPAFISRVNLGMTFPELDSETRYRIWKKLLGDLNTSQGASLLTDDGIIRKWATERLNGRQIRNVIYSAQLLAGSKEGSGILTREVIEDCLKDVIGFMDIINDEKKRVEMNHMSHWS